MMENIFDYNEVVLTFNLIPNWIFTNKTPTLLLFSAYIERDRHVTILNAKRHRPEFFIYLNSRIFVIFVYTELRANNGGLNK